MSKPQIIQTIKTFAEFRFKEKGSLFIGRAFPVETEEVFFEKLNDIKKEFYDATHHCYAFKLLDEKFKYSDDGEPSGTAGIRILNAIQHFDLINIGVISIRYYGGTKLGVGPLGKAYYSSAFETLKIADIYQKEKYSRLKISYSFEQTNLVHHLISFFNARIEKNNFENDKPDITCNLKIGQEKKFINELINSSNGKIHVRKIEEQFLE